MLALLIVVVSLVLLPLVGELAARWWLRHQSAYYVFPPGLRLLLHIDRDTFPELEPVVRYEVNSDGERGGEVPRLVPGETLYRVLVVGGSQPEGYLLDQETSWPGALERLLAAPDRLEKLGASRVHVGSIARSGVGSEALDLMLSRVLPRYPRLSMIVILVGASDVLRWLEEGAPSSGCAPARTSDIFRCHPEGPFGWRPKSTAIVEIVSRLRRRALRTVDTHHRVGKWIGQARAMRARAKVIRATVPDATPMLETFDRHFRRVIDQAKAHADRVVVVRQSWFDKKTLTPEEAAHMWHGGAGRAWCEEVSTYFSFEVTSELMAAMDARADHIARACGVEQVDLRSILEPSLDTYYDFFHLTPSGAAEVATAVAEVILHQGLRTGASREAYTSCAGLRAS